MRKVKVYVEGATRGKGKNQSANIALRRGFRQFADKLGIEQSPAFVPCGGRTQTWDVAWNSFWSRQQDEFILLLVDSEEPAGADPQLAWRHLKLREGWAELEDQHGRYVFMMVTAMETWLVADELALARKFGRAYRAGVVPKWQNLESVAKADIYTALDQATSGLYSKGERSFELVGEIDPNIVSARCPHAKHFCDSLKSLCW